MNKERIFVGTVNDKTYDNIADYSRALKDAINNGGLTTSTMEFKPAQQEDSPADNSKDEPDVLRYNHRWPFFDLDKLQGTAEIDDPLIANFLWTYMNPSMRDELIKMVQNCSSAAQGRLKDELKELISKLKEDNTKNLTAHNKLIQSKIKKFDRKGVVQREMGNLKKELVSIQDDINAIEVKDNITEGAERILKKEIDFYFDICKSIDNPDVKGRTVDKGHPGFILDHDQKETARKLFREIFGI